MKATIVEKSGNGPDRVLKKLILIELEFPDLELSPRDKCLNPLGVHILSYRIDDDTLSQ